MAMEQHFSLDRFDEDHPDYLCFPDPETADETGLLGSGVDLEAPTLLSAYLQGIFPWYNHGQPILWWSPNPRLILRCDKLHVSRSLRKRLRRKEYTIKCDTAFTEVMRQCANQKWRRDQPNNPDGIHTWINEEMIDAYEHLFELGFAHSIEVWKDDKLVGGLYGVSINGLFFGESMFSAETDTSKIALFYLCKFLKPNGCDWMDCQVESEHLVSLGAETIMRHDFLKLITEKNTHRQNIAWNNFASFAASIML